MLRLGLIIIATTFLSSAHAAPIDVPDTTVINDDFVATDEILNRTPDDTTCATAAFADALAANADKIPADAHENVVQQWVHQTFANPDVLRRVLACPEIVATADDETIKFLPIEYTFTGGRTITINYETQPKILKQRLALSQKRDTSAVTSPRLDDGAVWTNTDPAWYATMVVQHGALDAFANAASNHTISLNYIAEHIDELYPKNDRCTSRSAIAGDKDMINLAMHETVGLGKDDKTCNGFHIWKSLWTWQ